MPCCVLWRAVPCRAGELAEAMSLMQEATQNMMVDGTPAMHKITMGYNLARLQEATGMFRHCFCFCSTCSWCFFVW
jgi:hypothetical protein